MSLKQAKAGIIFHTEETAHLFNPDDDLRGRKFGRLTVTQFAYKRNKIYYYNCVCECGKECIKSRSYLIYKSSSIHKSCGCWRKEQQAKTTRETHNLHTLKHRPEYITWKAMKARCYNKGNKQFNDYGGRGIKVCAHWLNSFENFLADMGEKPSPAHSLDRINTNGDYCPENCRWATREEQANNKRSSIMIEYNGKIQTFAQWCKELNLPYYSALGLYKKGNRTFAEIVEYYTNKVNNPTKSKGNETQYN